MVQWNGLIGILIADFMLKTLSKTNLILVFIILFSIFSNFYNLEKRHGFAWDQERDANVIYGQLIEERRPTLIGPRVVGPTGFHLGPLHYYLIAPIYFVTQGDPIAGPISAGIVGVLTTIGYMFIAHKLFGKQVSIMAGLFSAFLPQTVFWNVMYMPLVSLFTYYFLLQTLKTKQYRYLLYALGLSAIGLQFHFTAIFLLIISGYVGLKCFFVEKKRRPEILRNVGAGLGVLFLSLLPIVVFDLRHDFLNTRNFFGFFTATTGTETGLFSMKGILVYLRGDNILTEFISESLNNTLNLIVTVLFIAEAFRLYRKYIVFNLLWVVVPLFAFSMYGGSISEYYFIVLSSVGLLYIATFVQFIIEKCQEYLKAGVVATSIVVVLLVGLTYLHGGHVLQDRENQSLYDKKRVMKFVADRSKETDIHVSLAFPYGADVGYYYFLDLYNIQSVDESLRGTVPEYTVTSYTVEDAAFSSGTIYVEKK